VSRTAFTCRQCGQILGHRHHSGRLHVAPGVTVYVDPKGRFGLFVRIVCPVCHKHRDYLDGAVVVQADDGESGSTSYTVDPLGAGSQEKTDT
jgi:ribosomal protein S27E